MTCALSVGRRARLGYKGGAWNGDGLSSSDAASTTNRALGFAEAADIGSPPTFAGQATDSTCVFVRFTIPGDANLDRIVDIGDFALVATNFNASSYWAKGDFNYDNITELGDFTLLAANFNNSLPGDLPRRGVPEPSTIATVLAAAALLRKRNGRA